MKKGHAKKLSEALMQNNANTLHQLGRSGSFSAPQDGKFPSLCKWFHRVIEKEVPTADVEQDDEIVHMVFSKEKQEDYTEKRLNKVLKEWQSEIPLSVGMWKFPHHITEHVQGSLAPLELVNPISSTPFWRPLLVKKITSVALRTKLFSVLHPRVPMPYWTQTTMEWTCRSVLTSQFVF
jgi:hypothetical protein